MKHPIWLAIFSGMVLNSLAFTQTASHFDVSANVSISGTQLAGVSTNSVVPVNAGGWQTSAISRFNRWLSLTSQFSSSSASLNPITLIGYTGPANVKHYSVLSGPRITIPIKGRVNPFVQGLAGYDRASTSMTSGTTTVNGNETQIAYLLGAGTQVDLTRRFALNVEAGYLRSEHTFAYTGWEPSHVQFSAGIVIRLFGLREPRIAREAPQPAPSASPATAESATADGALSTKQPAPATQVASVPATPLPQTEITMQSKPDAIVSEAPEPTTAAPMLEPEVKADVKAEASPNSPQPAQVSIQEQTLAANPPTAPMTSPMTAPAVTTATMAVPVPAQPTPNPATLKPTPAVAQAAAPAPSTFTARPAARDQAAQGQQSQSMSLGEYARRLRQKKQSSSAPEGSRH